MHPLIGRIIETRGINAETFLNPSYEGRHSPFLLKDMDVAVERILQAIRNNEKIAIWHDYDCDGIPGGALLFDFFRAIQYPVHMYVPERSDGYGLNEGGLRYLRDQSVSLVITVDCGITDIAEVAYARELGIDVIVTDHHLPVLSAVEGPVLSAVEGPVLSALVVSPVEPVEGPLQEGRSEEGRGREELPKAVAVINAHREDDTYPFKGLCGTGTAFKLVEALIERGAFSLPVGWEKWLLDLVALATVADMVPLSGENRALVRWGLQVLCLGRRPGLKALFEIDRIPIESATEDDLAFSIAPKINAASRMKSPRLAFELLTTSSLERARELARELVSLNKERKTEGMRVAKEVKRRVEALPSLDEVIVLGHSSWRPSLLGIAATGIVETYGKSVFLWGKEGNLLKGSCRSNGFVNMVSLMSAARHVFTDFGGHESAGGFSIAEENIHLLPGALAAAFISLALPHGGEALRARGEPDGFLTIAEANETAYDALRLLAPFGEGNPKPVFRLHNVTVEKFFRFGAHKDHARLVLSDTLGRTVDAISFFFSRTPFRDVLMLLSRGDSVTLDASLERSHFNGKKELRLRIEHIAVL